ncbi:MAG: hypothetical protein HYY06_25230 [Deltaproteobacteria bacterium]|nr:hypothetical protein [Deltaproteobacteria bacterium]
MRRLVLALFALGGCVGSLREGDGGTDGDPLGESDGGADGGNVEPCNGLDDDGDGKVDVNPDGSPLSRSCETACGTGSEYCEAGEWVCYAPQPRDEVCDNFDNDCDGDVDEGCSCSVGDQQPCGPENVGACRRGVQTCQAGGSWGECTGAVEPEPDDSCGNGVDDDCNGQTDETCGCTPGEEQACGTDEGECVPGSQSCSAEGLWEDCVGVQGPWDEVCNGLDDNCDGTADEFWEADEYEQNDTCDRRYWVGEIEQDSEPIVMNDMSLFEGGDEDWFSMRCQEGNNWCVPGTSECTYRITVQVALESGIDPDDVEVCAIDGSCTEAADPNRLFCTHAANWYDEWDSYLLALVWGGTCGADDSKEWQVVVRGAGGSEACGYYGIAWSFERTDEECP